MGSLSMLCKQTQQALLDFPPNRLSIDLLSRPRWQKDKVIFVIGATGTGKSRLSVDLATRFPAEIVNSDKMQLHRGLDIVTNKITKQEQCGVPHHLLGIAGPDENFTADDFCDSALLSVQSIIGRGKLPIIVGGSNSYIEALVDGKDSRFSSRFDCCFLWIDVSMPVLHRFVSDRVDAMVASGMVAEAEEVFDHQRFDYDTGIRKAIGVPEFDSYFRSKRRSSDLKTQARLLREAIEAVKENTCRLACRQVEKIQRLRNVKRWRIERVDATEVFRNRGRGTEGGAWEEVVEGPSAMIVRQFLCNVSPSYAAEQVAVGGANLIVPAMGAALAAATH